MPADGLVGIGVFEADEIVGGGVGVGRLTGVLSRVEISGKTGRLTGAAPQEPESERG